MIDSRNLIPNSPDWSVTKSWQIEAMPQASISVGSQNHESDLFNLGKIRSKWIWSVARPVLTICGVLSRNFHGVIEGVKVYIGRDFKNDIAHKVNRKTCVICRSRYMEVLRSSPRWANIIVFQWEGSLQLSHPIWKNSINSLWIKYIGSSLCEWDDILSRRSRI